MEAVYPKGVQATVTDSGHVIVEFDHADVPPIKLSSKGAEQVGSYLNSAANRINGKADL